MNRTAWGLIIVALLCSLVAIAPYVVQNLSMVGNTIPPGWTITDSKKVTFASWKVEMIYNSDRMPTGSSGVRIDRSGLPISFMLGAENVTIEDTWQDENGCAIRLNVDAKEYTLYVYRPSNRTYPAELSSNTRIYITNAKMPDRVGGWLALDGEPFYGFLSINLSLCKEGS